MHTVVLVDDQVAVLVDELHVTGLYVVRIGRLRRGGEYLHAVLEDAVHDEHIERTDRITGFGQGDIDAVVHAAGTLPLMASTLFFSQPPFTLTSKPAFAKLRR